MLLASAGRPRGSICRIPDHAGAAVASYRAGGRRLAIVLGGLDRDDGGGLRNKEHRKGQAGEQRFHIPLAYLCWSAARVRRRTSALANPIKATGATIAGAACQPRRSTHRPSATGPANWPRLLACWISPRVGGTARCRGRAWGCRIDGTGREAAYAKRQGGYEGGPLCRQRAAIDGERREREERESCGDVGPDRHAGP